jgi:2-C-methyl-D-erythritol 4-phosphate cytidylyltransferase
MPTKLHILVPASGLGLRFNADRPKQYLPFLGITLLDHCLSQLMSLPYTGQFIVGLAEDDPWWDQTDSGKSNSIRTVIGGATRAETVSNMLRALRDVDLQDWVLVHDAVRPCVSKNSLQPLLDAMQVTQADGLSLGRPIYEAVKRVSDQGKVLVSEKREGLWTIQTPQVFRIEALEKSLQACLDESLSFDDEMMALHHLGYTTGMVQGSALNIKVTTREDLSLAGHYWQIMQSQDQS